MKRNIVSIGILLLLKTIYPIVVFLLCIFCGADA